MGVEVKYSEQNGESTKRQCKYSHALGFFVDNIGFLLQNEIILS